MPFLPLKQSPRRLLLSLWLTVASSTLVHGAPLETNHLHAPPSIRRGIQEETASSSCGPVTSISLYNPVDGGSVQRIDPPTPFVDTAKVILLDQFPDNQLSVLANVNETLSDGSDDLVSSTSCSCVRLSLGEVTRQERVAPYTLYGDTLPDNFNTATPVNGEEQVLSAWTYTNTACTQGESAVFTQRLLFVARTMDTVVADPFVLDFNSTSGPATAADVELAAKTTCDYIKGYLAFGFVYRSNVLHISDDYRCTFTAVTNESGSSLTMQFDVSSSFRVSDGFNPYLVRDIPTVEELNNGINYLVQGGTQGPFSGLTLLQSIQTTFASTSPFSSTNALTIATDDSLTNIPTLAPVVMAESAEPSDVPSDVPSQAPVTSQPTSVPFAELQPTNTMTGDGFLPDGTCFSSRATVSVRNKPKPILMSELSIGDLVLTGTNVYAPVYAFGHIHTSMPAVFLQIHSSSTDPPQQQPLEVSKEHMVYVHGRKGPIRADSIVVGDRLRIIRDDNGHAPTTDFVTAAAGGGAYVTRIERVEREGIYAPLTPDGTIVVDGIVSSNYAGVVRPRTSRADEYVELSDQIKLPLLQADVIHACLSPLRFVCTNVSPSLCQGTYHDARGLHMYLARGIDLIRWGEAQCLLVKVTALSVVLFVAAICCIIEYSVSITGMLTLLTLRIGIAIFQWRRGVATHDTRKGMES